MPPSLRLSRVILYGLVFLLFFQLVADFVETIYTFGLLNTDVPPETVSILLFFSPLVLLLFPRGLPRRVGLELAGLAALMRALEVVLDKGGKMLSSGLGVGCLLVFLPLWLAQPDEEDAAALEMGAGLALALAFSILFRALGSGSDLTLLYPWLSWILAAGLVALVIWLGRGRHLGDPAQTRPEVPPRTSFGACAALSLAIMGALAVLYFAFTSPTVLARWSGVDYALTVGLLALALGLYVTGLAAGNLVRLSTKLIWAWNAVFLLAGTLAIWTNQVRFPAASGAYPIDQPELSFWQQIPLLVMILLSPVVLLDLLLAVREIKARHPSPRYLAGGFAFGALFFLLVVLGQVFTSVYDYIPVIGPWFRDRFWLVFLLTGLGTGLAAVAVARTLHRPASTLPMWQALRPAFMRRFALPGLLTVYVPLVGAALMASFVWVAINDSPVPTPRPVVDTLRIVTYNIQQGYSADGRRSYADQLAVIRGLDADIVGLQESDVARFSGGNADVVRTIAQGLGMYAYYGPRTVTGTFGIALLSRYPLEDAHTFYMYSVGEQTAAIEAQVHWNNKPYHIVVTHLGNDGPMIQQQNLLSRLAGQSNLVAMGDFNFDTTTPQYALTLQSLRDAWVQAGSPPASGLDMPAQIDHVFVSPGVRVRAARFVPSPASDHPALLVAVAP